MAEDRGRAIVVDASGHAYVIGHTASPDFCSYLGSAPGFDTTYNGDGDAYVMKIKPDGSGLDYCTHLGGGDLERGNSISIDSYGNSFVTGSTWSTDFPTTAGAYSTVNQGLRDIFVVKTNTLGTQLEYSSYFGGSDQDEGTAIAVGPGGEASLTGWTKSADFDTTPGAYDGDYNGGTWDAFATRFKHDGSALLYSSFLGGDKEDRGLAISINANGDAFVAGSTRSSNFPSTPGAFDREFGGGDCGPELCSDGFVTEIDSNGENLVYSTYLGGSEEDVINSLELDQLGRAYSSGQTRSASTFPITSNAFDRIFNGGSDAFLSVFGVTGGDLLYSTFLGGIEDDSALGVRISRRDDIYLTSRTRSSNFPTTPQSYDPLYNGDYDAFVTALYLPMTFRSYLPVVSKLASS